MLQKATTIPGLEETKEEAEFNLVTTGGTNGWLGPRPLREMHHQTMGLSGDTRRKLYKCWESCKLDSTITERNCSCLSKWPGWDAQMQKMEGGPFSQYTELPVKQYQGMQTHPSDRLSTDREQADSEEKGQSWKAKFLNGS